ncbi:MAG: MmgE/PrpD family protein [Thermodesulfobacteriota bacterium]
MVAAGLGELCRFAAEARLEVLPARAVEWAGLVLVDTLGVIAAGNVRGTAPVLAGRLAGAGAAEAGATCPGLSGGHEPLKAALVNGLAGSGLEFDEGNSRVQGMPAVQIAPAVVAAGETAGVSGAELLAGFIAGYEAAYRIGVAASLRPGLHPTGSWGVVGAALGAARIRRRRPEELVQIAHIASSYAFTANLRNSPAGHSLAETYAGLTGHLGLLADLFYESGVRADDSGFETTFGRFISTGLDPALLAPDPGGEPAITTGYLKPYPTCRYGQPALEALAALLDLEKVDHREVERLEVATFAAAAHSADGPPPNPAALRFSVPYLLAAFLVRGRLDLGVLTPETLELEAVHDLARKVALTVSPEYEARRPDQSPARVILTLKNGRVLSREVLDARGGAARPLGEAEFRDKFLGLAGPAVGDGRAAEFLTRAAGLAAVPDVRPLLRLLRRP